jgi:hypothetical protein
MLGGWELHIGGGLSLNMSLKKILIFLGVQETIKQEFSDQELKEMSGAVDFAWKWIPAKGHSGGVILGIKVDIFEVEQWEIANHFVGCLVRSRLTNFRFWVMSIYGPAHHELSEEFILELMKFCETEPLPILMGGRFQPH